MLEKRVKIQSVVESQLPDFLRSESQQAGDFLKTYYKSQEFQGAPVNILENIDQYVKVGTYTSIVGFTSITSSIDATDSTISVDSTSGWPDTYGLLKINDEIISYTGKTDTSFTGCIRGFSGITSYRGTTGPDELIFEESIAEDHLDGSSVVNVSSLFLKEFFRKLKSQFLPGFENRELNAKVNAANFLRQSKDFYSAKGTENAFEILFKGLYGEEIKVIKPQDYLFIPSDAGYRRVLQLVVEALDGNPMNLASQTVYQADESGEVTAFGSVVDVEEIKRDDTIFYRINIDFDYNVDSSVFGSVFGEFRIDPFSKVIGNVAAGSTYITVDSTVGFGTTGALTVNFDSTTAGIITYTSKTINQFFDCVGITSVISDKTEISQNVSSYGYDKDGEQITFRAKGALGEYEIEGIGRDVPLFREKDVIELQSLGVDKDDIVTDSLVQNITSKLQVKSIKADALNFIIQTFDDHNFRVSDSIEVVDNLGVAHGGGILSIESDTRLTCNGLAGIQLDGTRTFTIRKRLQTQLGMYLSDISSTYFDVDENIYVASNSLPTYAQPLNQGILTLSGTYTGETIEYVEHGLITGEEIYYKPDVFVEILDDYGDSVSISTISNLGDLVEGTYFVKRVDINNFKLSNSRTDIAQDNYLSIAGIASAQKILPILSYENSVDATKQITKIPGNSTDSATFHETQPGITGVFVNGVDILNYKSEDYVYYGNITDLPVVNAGEDYDVINPPTVIIDDSVGTGATASVAVSGVLDRIEVLDAGSDFTTTPAITISGGNGIGAAAEANLKSEKVVNFVDTTPQAGYISTSNNIVGFSSYHRFRNGDGILYDNNDQTAIGIGSTAGSAVRDASLTKNTTYFAGVVGLSSITLHNKEVDAIAGINTINLTAYGTGNHIFTSVKNKSFLASVSIVNSGSNYRNNKIEVKPTGINTATNTVTYTDHGFESGDLVTYAFNGSTIAGMSTDQQYYVFKEGSDSFKVAAAGIGTTLSRTNYENKLFVDFTSVGVGTHIFNHPNITVNISGLVGIATTNKNTFQPTIQPYFRGSIDKINMLEGGTGYGSSDIINFEKQSLVTFENGADAQTKPVIVNGIIKEVLIIHGGYGYKAPPNLVLEGNGIQADLAPIISDGVLTGVKINNGGVGYGTATTFVSVVPSGKGASVRTKLTSWNINNFERYLHRLTGDDGILAESLNDYSSGTFASATVPRKLRETLYAKKNDGQRRYGQFDLMLENGVEQTSTSHSPIVGWAFDGHPIYGPYGYDRPDGGAVREMQTGYTKITNDNRPSAYELGFFVEDYQFTNSGDLDERNGRFCRTPDYPNGVYAYFTTINNGLTQSSGPFKNYKIPEFPYVIGKYYKSQPDKYNFDRKNNQVQFEYDGLRRNTKSSKVNSEYGGNDYLSSTIDDINQQGEITRTTKGEIPAYAVVAAGTSYKSGEYLDLNQPSPAFGERAIARVKNVVGKKIVKFASSTTAVNNIEFYVENGEAVGYATTPHGFENRDLAVLSGLSTDDFTSLRGLVKINNSIRDQKTWYTESGIGTVGATGLTTTISLLGSYDPLTVRENTIIGIGTSTTGYEQLKVLNIDPLNHRMRVQREYNDTTGIAYSSRTLALELPSTVRFPVGFTTFTSNPPTFQRYFNAPEVVGLGTTAIVGIGTTVTYQRMNNIAPPNKPENDDYQSGIGGTSRIIPIKTILIPNHSFETGDKLTYFNGGGTSIQVSNGSSTFTLSDGSTVYAIKEASDLLGISTTKVGLGSTGTVVGLGSTAVQLSFTSAGVGVTHSFKLDSSPITGSLSVHEATFTTKEPHGLVFQDRVNVSVVPGFTTSIFVEYNPFNRKMTFDRRSFGASDVDTTNNRITLTNHKLGTGDKVIFTTGGTAPTGLSNNGEYFVIFIDKNTFKLASTLRNSNGAYPVPVRISAGGSGEHFVSQITPRVLAVIGTKVGFALTDSSLSFNSGGNNLPAFTMKFYRDENFNDQFISSKTTRDFEVTGVGTVGVSSDAKTTIAINDFLNSPPKLYYKFDPINTDTAPSEQTGIVVDKELASSSTIELINSVYGAVEYPTGIGSTTFTYLLPREPEKSGYDESGGVFQYTTNSLRATGPIGSIEVVEQGSGYESLPGITSIKTDKGSGAIIRPRGTMGRIQTSRLKDTGYNYPSDPTLKVFANVPEVLMVEELCSIDEVGITSGGKNYLVPPSFVVRDKYTQKVIDDVLLESKIKNGSVVSVNVLSNTKTLSDTPPEIISINNSNGVGIRTVGFNTLTKEVDVYFDVGFSTAGSFPFSLGDKVYVENVGIASTGSGYNSVDYNYTFFELTSIDENIGGIGSVTYKLDSTPALAIGVTVITDPGLYTTVKSYGRMIPPDQLPIYAPTLKKNDFSIGEVISSANARGTVSLWDASSKTLKVNSKKEFEKDDIVTGQATRTAAKVLNKYDVNSHYNISAAPLVIKGWTKDTGKLNDATQRIIDSDYYQYFSYSLKSKIAYETWEEVVDSLNHTAGFKKFSDLIIESESDDPVAPIIDLADLSSLIELISEVSTYSTFDFDYVVDKALTISNQTFANEILFRNKSLTDFEESIGNRVLTIDDFSNTFNSDPRAEKFSVIDTFPISQSRYRKYIISVNDTKFTDNVQISLVEILISDDGQAFVSEYADVDTDQQSYFDIRISGQNGELLFYPTLFSVNSYQISGLTYNIDRVPTHGTVGLSTIVGIGTIADIITLDSRGSKISAGITTAVNVVTFSASDYNSARYIIEAHRDNVYQSINISVLTNGSVLDSVEYNQMWDADRETPAGVGLGTFGTVLSGGNVYINFTPDADDVVGSAVTFNIVEAKFHSGVSTLGIGTSALENGLLVAGFTTIASSGSPGITTIASFTEPEDAFYAYVEVEDLTNNHLMWSEIVGVSNENGSAMTEYGILATNAGLGTFGLEYISDGKCDLQFTPNASIITNVRTFLHTTRPQVSSAGSMYDLDVAQITNIEGSYEGTEVDLMRAFGLFHETQPIFTRNFDASDSAVVDLEDNLVIIPNHFFVTGERLQYTALGTGTTSHIGIATTSISGVSTDKLPADLYAIKKGEKALQFAGSAEDALASTPINLDLTTVGIGTSHVLQAYDQNSKCIIALDNNIQDPVVSTGVTHVLLDDMTYAGEQLRLSGINSIFGADLLKIENEFVKIKTIGIGSTNSLLVQRGWMGTGLTTHVSGKIATKYVGGYNIVDNTLNFYTAPHGPKPSVVPSDPDEIDWTGIQTHSTFQGRMFMRSGVTGASTMTYSDNYIFDSISDEFTGVGKTFTLKVDGQNVSGFSTDNALILINDIAQGPDEGATINNFSLEESAGISSVVFSGMAASTTSDIHAGTIPVGGTLVSVGSSDGYGYQPLIGAGGTAIISGFGTVQSVSLGNTGSGYRAGIQTTDLVIHEVNYSIGIRTNSDSLTAIGTVTIAGGHVTGVVLDTPYTAGTGYTFSDPPEVLIQEPLNYANIPLIYHGDNAGPGLGSMARADIIVSQDSTVNSFRLTNNGYGYREDEIITVPVGGVAGIPTNTSITDLAVGYGLTNYPIHYADYNESTGEMVLSIGSHSVPVAGIVTLAQESLVFTCSKDNYLSKHAYPRPTDPAYNQGLSVTAANASQITVNVGVATNGIYPHSFVGAGHSDFRIHVEIKGVDKFTGWHFGKLDVFDTLAEQFDGNTKVFILRQNGTPITIKAQKGSLIDVEKTLLVFVNDILQEPGEAFTFRGGSQITFTEAPKAGDSNKIMFYKGTGDLDVVTRDVMETIKKGDTVQIEHGDLADYYEQEPRVVSGIVTADTLNTSPYIGPGLTTDTTIIRPLTWTRQTEDVFINGIGVGKDRSLYEPLIHPAAYCIKSAGIGSTTFYVDSVRPFFDPDREAASTAKQNTVTIISQDSLVGAAATAQVSGFGTITTFDVTTSGIGYTLAPTVTIGNPVGLGTTFRAEVSASITSGIVTTIVVDAGSGGSLYTFTSPPEVLIEQPKSISEDDTVTNYEGDQGTIVGFGTTTISNIDQLILDFFIPMDSDMRSTSVMGAGAGVTISGINTGDYFLIRNSNVGQASTEQMARDTADAIVGIGSQYIDNVYQVNSVSTVSIASSLIGVTTTGVGVTYARRVYTKISGISTVTFGSTGLTFDNTNYTFDNNGSGSGGSFTGSLTTSNYYGDFSWGKLIIPTRSETNAFNAYTDSTVGGISTSALIIRTNALKSASYSS